jgi:hypothetical protein
MTKAINSSLVKISTIYEKLNQVCLELQSKGSAWRSAFFNLKIKNIGTFSNYQIYTLK